MDGQLSAHHLEIMRRSLACGGLPSDQMAWILSEAARFLAERDRARSVILGLIGPMTELRGGLNELHTLFGAGAVTQAVGRPGRNQMGPARSGDHLRSTQD